MDKLRLLQINLLPESIESRKRRIARMSSPPTLRENLVSAWQWSADWPWFTAIFGVAFAVTFGMGEYGFAETFLLLAAVGASSQLIHQRKVGWFLKTFGMLVVLFLWVVFSYATYKEKDSKPWSHIQPLIEDYELNQHPLIEEAKKPPAAPISLIPIPPTFALDKPFPAVRRTMIVPKQVLPQFTKTSGLPLSVSISDPTDPVIRVDNQNDSLVEGLIWEVVIFRVEDQAFFSFITKDMGYLKPHSKSPGYKMQLNTLAHTPVTGGEMAAGQHFIGTLSVDCPKCSGSSLIVSFVWGSSGWFYEVPNGGGHLFLPKDISKQTVAKFVEALNAVVKPENRIPIL
jgi:hypothetical protein